MRRRLLRPNSQIAAFTLIELLVVIVILGILMAVAVPTFLRQQAKAQDSRTQQYLTTAYKAIRSGTPDTGNIYPSSTSMVSWVQQSEPELTVQRASCYTGSATAPTDAVLVDPSSSANSLLLCSRAASGNVWELSATATSAPTLINGTLVPLTFSGSEITDATRAADVQGDGLTGDSSTGIWEGTTNLWKNGGFESGLGGWSGVSGGTIAQITSDKKFGITCMEIIADGTNQAGARTDTTNSGAMVVVAGTTYVASAWLKGPAGRLIKINVTTGNNSATGLDSTQTTVTASGNWQRVVVSITPSAGAIRAGITVGFANPAPPAGAIVLADGVQFEQKPFATPYVETSGSTSNRSAARVQAPAGLLSATQGWVAMRVRLGLSTAASNSFHNFFALSDGTNTNRLIGYFQKSDGDLHLERDAPAGNDFVGVSPGTLSVGDTLTLVFAWNATSIEVSVNGGAFTSGASTHIPSVSVFDIGSDRGFSPIDGDILWFACGTGAVTNSDATTIGSFGNTDPTRANLPSSAQTTMTWDGTSSSGSLK